MYGRELSALVSTSVSSGSHRRHNNVGGCNGSPAVAVWDLKFVKYSCKLMYHAQRPAGGAGTRRTGGVAAAVRQRGRGVPAACPRHQALPLSNRDVLFVTRREFYFFINIPLPSFPDSYSCPNLQWGIINFISFYAPTNLSLSIQLYWLWFLEGAARGA